MNQATTEQPAKKSFLNSRAFLGILFFLIYPWGVIKMWNRRTAIWKKLVYTVFGLPIFLVLYTFLSIIVFALFLPPLDLSMGDRKDRTVRYNAGNYQSTFVKTGKETNGAYELIRVEVDNKGGNGFHYHTTFTETFTVLKGELNVEVKDRKMVLKEGQSFTVPTHTLHHFYNTTDSLVLMEVKTSPANGLEKSVRVAYGLSNSNKWGKGPLPKNLWHLFLLLAYSDTYLPDIPGFIQEPLVRSLAKIAQWKGEDKELEVFFR